MVLHFAVHRRKLHIPIKKLLVIMKLTALLLLAACLVASASGHSQNVTLTMKNAPVEKVFEAIKKQTGYDFVYKTDVLQQAGKVNIAVQNASLQQALEICFKNQPLTYKIFDSFIAVKAKDDKVALEEEKLTPPPIDVKGRVVNESGEPIVATVTVKGTNTAVTTDENGFFVIKGVEENATLVVSGVSIETYELKISGKNELATVTVKMKVKVGEIVVINTGYETVSPDRATGSFNYIGKELLDRKVSTSVLSRIDGITPSVLFDQRTPGDTKIQIRGQYTLRSNTQPLIILDKFPYEGNINDINPNDVESITILKDAAATSIWGSQAGNGVIVITTKKGAKNGPLQLSINANTTIVQKSNLFDLPQIPSADYIELEKFLFSKGAYTSDINHPFKAALSPVIEILLKKQNGQLSETEANQQIERLKQYDIRNDFNKYIYQTGINQQYAINTSGSGKNVKYFFSAGYDKNRSNLIGNSTQRISFRNNTTVQATNKLQVDIGIFYTLNETKNNSFGNYGNSNYARNDRIMLPYSRLVDNAGNSVNLDTKYRNSFTDTAGGGKLLNWKFNPLDEMQYRDYTTKANAFIGDLSFRYQLLPSLSLEASYRYQNNNSRATNYNGVETFYTRDLINRYAQLGGSTLQFNIPLGGIMDLYQVNGESHNVRGGLSYNKTIGGKHQLSGIAGAEARQAVSINDASRVYGFNKMLNFASVDYVTYYPTYFGFTSQIPNNENHDKSNNRFTATYANVSYTYDRKYTLTASYRKDASNIFGVNANRKGSPFWSVGGSWRLSDESFYHLSSILPYLRLRGTYGYNGNSIVALALTTISLLPASTQITNIPYASINNPPNPNLKWEKVKTINFGIDFRIKDNRLSGSIEYYVKKSLDVIAPQIFDPTTGVSTVSNNSGDMAGKGIDINLSSINIQTSNIQWSTNFNFSYVTYKTTAYFGTTTALNTSYTTTGLSATPIVGYNPYTIFSHRWAGLDANGDPQGYLNGKVSKNWDSLTSYNPLSAQANNGVGLPPYFGNILNTFRWKQFTLSANIVYRLGHSYRRPSVDYGTLISGISMNSDYMLRWQKPGDEVHTSVPSFVYPDIYSRNYFYNSSEATIRKAGNIRLTDIQVAYDLLQPQQKSRSVKSISIYCYLNNINCFLYKASKDSLDPDAAGALLSPISMSFGTRINF